MNPAPLTAVLLTGVLPWLGTVWGQAAAEDPPVVVAAASPTSVAEAEAGGREWSFAASLYAYSVPEDDDYVQPTVLVDRGLLHLEARYNYEALETGSVWLGFNFSGGGDLAWELTPMVGGVFGETMGAAPGYRGSLGWWKLELSSEGEYVFNLDTSTPTVVVAFGLSL
jgi:hypothetical protein